MPNREPLEVKMVRQDQVGDVFDDHNGESWKVVSRTFNRMTVRKYWPWEDWIDRHIWHIDRRKYTK